MKGILMPYLKAIILCGLLILGTNSYANATTLTFGELPNQSVNGLSYMGINFGFQIAGVGSTDAYYNGSGPGTLTYVQDPSLEGNSNGVLSFDFTSPVNSLSFGLALDTGLNLTPGFQVELFAPDDVTSLGLTAVNTSRLTHYSENQFIASSGPIGLAKVSFNNPNQYGRFAVDNLTYDSSAVPEPASLSLLGIGLLGLLKLRKKRVV